MTRVIQIRDVPDDVHDALTTPAQAHGLSLTRYMLLELEQLAKRAQVVRANTMVVRQTQAEVRGGVDRDTILEALREGRGDGESSTPASSSRWLWVTSTLIASATRSSQLPISSTAR